MAFVKKIQALTLEQAVSLDKPKQQLSQLKDSNADEFITLQIVTTAEYLEKPMNLEKACQITADLFERFWFFSIDDVLLFLKRGRQGIYNESGQISVQFNAQTVLMWAGKYELERTEWISKQRVAENQLRKQETLEALPQELYKGAVYNPNNEGKKKRDAEWAYKQYKAQYYKQRQETQNEAQG